MPEPKRCHSCGESTDPSAKFCESCGAEQLEQATESSSVPAVRYCQACGAGLSATVEFDGRLRCSKCGVRVEGDALAAPVPTAVGEAPAAPGFVAVYRALRTKESPGEAIRSLVDHRIKRFWSQVPGLILAIIVVIVIGFVWLSAELYTEGTFDRALAPWGLNWNKCAENIFGRVMCGEQLEEFCRENPSDSNREVCDEILAD